jgi:hypothetical protein
LAYASGEQFRLATINDANNTAVNFMVVDRTGTTIDEIALNGTRISVNGSLWTPAQVNFTAGAAGFIEFVNRSAGALGFKWYTGANASLNPMTLGSAGNLTVTGWFNSSAGVSSIGTQYIGWGVAPSTSYGSCYVTGTGGGYHGITVYDGAVNLCMMGNAVTAGLYSQGDANWVIYRQNGTNVGCGFTFNANAFNATSSRKIKRETGKPTRAADILSKLRPILYRLLKDESREQLGLIAEEVHDVCPQMSDGKTISYDRLAILLLTDWQESRGLALN